MEAYDPDTDSWSTVVSMPVGRHASGAVVIGNVAYIVGGNKGCGGSQPAKDVLVFKLN